MQGEKWNPPECFGTFWCPDDCIVSCKYGEECMDESNEEEEDELNDIGMEEEVGLYARI